MFTMSQTDIVVLGGGIIGAALAEECARRGRRVVVLERGRVGLEASSAAAGILSAQMDLAEPGPFFELCQAARRLYPAWVRRIERAARVSTEFRINGILYAAATSSEVRVMTDRVRWQRSRGIRVERWSPEEIRRHEPAVEGPRLGEATFLDEPPRALEVVLRCLREERAKRGRENT